MSVYTRKELAPDTTVLSAPFALAITPSVSLESLRRVLGGVEELKTLSERELVNCYVAMHWVARDLGERYGSERVHHSAADSHGSETMR